MYKTQALLLEEIYSYTKRLAEKLIYQESVLAVAESCSGGLLCKCITDISGCSQWFDRGFVVYSNQAKQDVLNVAATTLNSYGAVSQETVLEMAQGVLEHSQARFVIAITGIAGPGGGTSIKPVGTVWIATGERLHLQAIKYYFKGDREAIRLQSVLQALQQLSLEI